MKLSVVPHSRGDGYFHLHHDVPDGGRLVSGRFLTARTRVDQTSSCASSPSLVFLRRVPLVAVRAVGPRDSSAGGCASAASGGQCPDPAPMTLVGWVWLAWFGWCKVISL